MLLPGAWKLVAWRCSRLQARGGYDKAERLARHYCRRRAADPQAWFTLVGVLSSSGRSWSDLDSILREALIFNRGNERLKYWLAESLRQQGLHEEAETLLRRSMAEHPSSPLPYLGLANLSEARGDPAETRIEFATDASKYASEANAWHSEVTRIAAHLLTGGKKREARALLERVTPVDDAWGCLYLAVILEKEDLPRSRGLLEAARKNWGDERDFDIALEECRAAARTGER
jgi:tetratricopeptide (TPR) repeat protein